MTTEFCSNNLGRDARLYRNTGTVVTPVWTEVTEARGLQLPMAADKVEQSDRSTRFKLYDSGGIDISFSGKLSYRSGNANCEALRDLMLDNCAEQMALMSDDITVVGAEGIKAGMKVFTNSHDYPFTDGKTIDIELAPCYYENPTVAGVQIVPIWYVVT